MATTRLYWRKIQALDGSWVFWALEMDDFTSTTGRCSLARVWEWPGAEPDETDTEDKPWRARLEGVPYSNRDYPTLDRAMTRTVRRVCKEHGIQKYTLEGAQLVRS